LIWEKWMQVKNSHDCRCWTLDKKSDFYFKSNA